MIHIVTDSTADFSKEKAEKLGIHVAPLSIHFETETYQDGIDLSTQDFFEKLDKAKNLPTTSQVNPDAFEKLFRSLLRSPEDEIIGIFISSTLSGTFQSAVIAKDICNTDAIHLIDSKNVTFGLALLILEAVALRDQGKSATEIIATTNDSIPKLRLYAAVNTLKYLKMGGRISTASAFVGDMLGITPLISIADGKVDSVGKTRGKKAALRWLERQILKDNIDKNRRIAFGHTNDKNAMEECIDYFEDKIPTKNSLQSNIGATVGVHAGPGAFGIAYFVK